MAELADAHGSGPCTRKGVGVRVPSSAPSQAKKSINTKKSKPCNDTQGFSLFAESVSIFSAGLASLRHPTTLQLSKMESSVPIRGRDPQFSRLETVASCDCLFGFLLSVHSDSCHIEEKVERRFELFQGALLSEPVGARMCYQHDGHAMENCKYLV